MGCGSSNRKTHSCETQVAKVSIRDRAAEDLRIGALAITCNLLQALCNALERLNYRPYRPDNKNPKGSDYGINDCGEYHFWLLPCRLTSRGHYVTRSLTVVARSENFNFDSDPGRIRLWQNALPYLIVPFPGVHAPNFGHYWHGPPPQPFRVRGDTSGTQNPSPNSSMSASAICHEPVQHSPDESIQARSRF